MWRDCTLKETLINYRDYLYDKYKSTSAKIYYGKIISILNYYEVELGKIEHIKSESNDLILTDEIITFKEIKQCINSIDSPIIKATALLMSSTGLSPADILKISVKEYIQLNNEYHNFNNHHNIRLDIKEMNDKDIIITIRGYRKKSKVEYITFASPESIKAVNSYLLSCEKLSLDDPLFNISRGHLKVTYARINNQLGLGVTDEGYARFSMKYMRSYHATQLEKAGMHDARINILQGRVNNTVICKHYIKVSLKELKEDYIRCLPYIVVEDINKVKSELDNVKEELEV